VASCAEFVLVTDCAIERLGAQVGGGAGDFVLARARELADTVFRRFLAQRFAAFRTVTVAVRFTGFVTVSRSRTDMTPFTNLAQLQDAVRQRLEPFFDARENPKAKKVRLIGCGWRSCCRLERSEVLENALSFRQ
jgi:hypothetical protein